MSFLQVLEVAIGLVFVWILMSLAVMQTQEWIVGWLAIRADGLEEAIWGLLADPKPALGPFRRAWEQMRKIFNRLFGTSLPVPDPPPLVKELYEHPLVQGLAQGGGKPSYIPADKFALALFDVVMTAGTPDAVIKKAIREFEAVLDKLEVTLTPDQVKNSRKALNQLLRKKGPKLDAGLEQLRQDPQIGAELDRLLAAGETDAEVIKTALRHLEGQLEYLKIRPRPEHIRMMRAILRMALRENRDLNWLKAVFDRLRLENPDIGPVLDAGKPVLDAYLRAEAPKTEQQMLNQINAGANALAVSNPGLKRVLNDLVANANAYATQTDTAIAVARANVETWFNDTMDRANGWYKRNRQIGAFVIGLIFAALINVDSLDIGVHLWREPALRQAVVAQAERYKLPDEAGPGPPQGAPQDLEELQDTFTELQTSLTVLRVPIGWKFSPVELAEGEACSLVPTGGQEAGEQGDAKPGGSGQGQGGGLRLWVNGQCLQWQAPQGWGLLSKLVGLIATAAAATFGAPFWFDVLQKLISLRSAGNVPQPAGHDDQTQS